MLTISVNSAMTIMNCFKKLKGLHRNIVLDDKIFYLVIFLSYVINHS